MYLIARHENGISLNNYEYVLDVDGNVMKFSNEDEAMHFLNNASGEELSINEWSDSGIYILNEDEIEDK